ncbi:MAG: SusC/RagA family TonB-linked outer membrane protein [Chitinophagaceae bacterium]|nr:SusC/RagA family TonB-linked outer membrane protein [Chitinophagaceae bacterium]MBP7107393.1 SusC/RagA family TonB-linked outer membrane protein [Chitinophagaceae bacterium]MBP7315397.1 SusC/RagA family TonB-linked outer membrane protein [Chitinophagaceae bacterium]HRA10159.1 SusC/RagA family TonB-linked outer membrane protein [Chitinophagaceae bacterium]
MKLIFLCRQEKGKPVVQRQPFSGALISSHCTLPAISFFYFFNLNNLIFMRLLTTAAKKLLAGPRLLLACFLLTFSIAVSAQEKTVSGVVKNPEDASPIANATVQIKGTKIGTLTDDKGAYSLKANDNQTLVISAVGFATVEIKVGNKSSINVDLVNMNKEMEGVVVTALGIKRDEKALGYSVSKVKGEDITEAMSNNWTNALTGKVAGLNLIKSGGGPAGSNKIILRGENSLAGNSEALIVVDGVIISSSSGQQTGTGSTSYLQSDSPVDFGSSLNDINPEDIESVSVLKGPGASALYGARGANGAIIITTKSGSSRQKGLGITYNLNASIDRVNRWMDYQNEYGQGTSGQDTWYSYNASEDGPSTRSTSSAWGPRFAGQSYYQYDPVTGTKSATRLPWVPYERNRKDFFETGHTLINSITIDGGNANTSVRLSLTNLNNTWIVPNTGYKRNTVALSVSHKLSDKLQLAAKVNYTNKVSDNLPSTGYNNQSIMYFIRGLTPNVNLDWIKPLWTNDTLVNISQNQPFSSLLDNPYVIANAMLNKSNRNGVIGNVSATYNFTKDFSIAIKTALDYSSEARSQQRPFDTNKFPDGMFRSQNIFTQELNTDFLIRYGRDIGKKFNVVVSGGGSQMRNKYIRDELRADQLNLPGYYNLANSKNPLVALPYRANYRVNSFYGLAQISFDKFLFFDATARQDWASTLATPPSPTNEGSVANTGFFYSSFNLSAVLSEKIKLPAAISFLKVRGSLAGVGSGGITPYKTSFTYNPTLFSGGLTNPPAIANPNLQSLLTQSVEFGLDVRFLKNRLGLDVAVYKNNTKKQILDIPIDRSSGYSATVGNAGLVRNTGIEVQLNGTVLQSPKGFNWNIFGTYAANRNKVVSLIEGIDVYVMSVGPANRGSIQAVPGGRMGDLYGIGYNRAPDGQIIYNAQGLPTRTTEIKYLGNTTPDWKGSFGSEFKYKNFRLNFLMDGQFGGVAYSLTHAVLMEEGKLNKTLPGRYNGIVGDGVQYDAVNDKYVPNTIVATNIQAYYDAHFNRDNVEANTFSTDFIKLREVRFDYTFAKKLVSKLKLQRATLGAYGRDLFVITKWPGYDPEFGTLENGTINAGFEIAQFPSTRTMGLSLTVGF